MSRCFPFPPPGYEKTARPDGLASLLLDKEKHKEKKHKKDKKDREKKEGKGKKDKERSKDKHKDKKDRKERHKDKKKDKNKDKSRESEGVERHGEAPYEQKFGESSRKSEEIKDSKFREELARRIQDEKGAANRPIENLTVSAQQSREGFNAAPVLENERTAVNKMHITSITATRKNEGMGQQTNNISQQKNGTAIRRGENFPSLSQRTNEGFIAAPTMDKERVKVTKVLANSADSTPRKEGMGQRINNISILVQKKTESPSSETAKKEIGTSLPLLLGPVNAVQKRNGKFSRSMENTPTSVQRFDSPSTSGASAAGLDRGIPRATIPSPSITIRRPNGMVRPSESFSVSTQKKPDAGGLFPALGKEKDQGGRMLQNNISTDHKQVNPKPSSVEKVTDGRAERMEKARDGTPDDTKREDKKSHRHEKKKRKDKDKHKEKKKEKDAIKEKEELNHKEHDKPRENSINYQIDSLHIKPSALAAIPPSAPPPALPVDDAKAALVDGNIKKRKNHEMNGFLQNHHDMRPTKLPRATLSNTHVENGTASHVAPPLSSVKPDAVNTIRAERLVHKKEEKINGNPEAQKSSVDLGLRDPLAAIENGISSTKLPHPDSKYLSQIYTIPEAPPMMEWLEHDDQDWLFDRGSMQSKKPMEAEAEGAPQVWVQAMKIDTADVVALPYVIPF